MIAVLLTPDTVTMGGKYSQRGLLPPVPPVCHVVSTPNVVITPNVCANVHTSRDQGSHRLGLELEAHHIPL